MLKVMVFIDGSWFDKAAKDHLERAKNAKKVFIENIPFARLLTAIREHASEALGSEVDLVRAYCVAGYPDPDTVGDDSRESARRILAGWEKLRLVPGICLELYPYNYLDREFPSVADDGTKGEGVEKCVDVALATKMLFFAAIPAVYDLAVLVTGDSDFVPVVEAVRNLGKRVLLASFTKLPACSDKLKSEASLGKLWDLRPFDLGPVLTQHWASGGSGASPDAHSTVRRSGQ